MIENVSKNHKSIFNQNDENNVVECLKRNDGKSKRAAVKNACEMGRHGSRGNKAAEEQRQKQQNDNEGQARQSRK